MGLAKPRFDLTYSQPNLWQEIIPLIETYDHIAVVNCLLKNFIFTITSEISSDNDLSEKQYQRLLSSWRSSIRDSSQDRENNYKGTLLRAVRDSLSRLMKRIVKGNELINNLMSKDTVILKRICIYVIAQNAGLFPDKVYQLLTDEQYIYSYNFHNDYFVLLEMGFALMPDLLAKKN